MTGFFCDHVYVSKEGKARKEQREPLLLAQSDSADMATPWIGGVASGVAHRLGVPVGPVRAAFAALSALGGVGVVAYMWLWLTSSTESEGPRRRQEDTTTAYRAPMRAVGKRRDQQTTAGRLLVAGALFLVLAAAVALGGMVKGAPGAAIAWFVVAVIGVLLVWRQAPRLGTKLRKTGVAYVVLGLLLAVFGGLASAYSWGHIPSPKSGFVTALVVLLVTVLALGPLGMRVIRDLTAAKSSEAREMERADIAAHLHDSVLQTLTLIRGAAGDPARVRALALTQERELRSWLYTGQTEPEVSVAEALTNQAALVESTYGVEIEVVTVGDLEPGPEHLAAVAAAGEAMTNAVRHGAPPVTVFQEVRRGDLEIYVKDAGAGFDPQKIPDDRHGYSNSIVGRVVRVGGTVKLRFLPPPDPDEGERSSDRGVPRHGGTEIAIRIPAGAKPTRSGSQEKPARARVFVAPGQAEADGSPSSGYPQTVAVWRSPGRVEETEGDR